MGRAVAGAVAVEAGTFNITSYVLPAAMKTSFCTRVTPGSGFPSSAINPRPGTAGVPVCDPTIAGTCIRKPAFTIRTSTEPVVLRVWAGFDANNEFDDCVLSKPTPLIK